MTKKNMIQTLESLNLDAETAIERARVDHGTKSEQYRTALIEWANTRYICATLNIYTSTKG